MKKEEILFKKEEISFLNQIIRSMEDAEIVLEKSFEKRNYEKFNSSKKFLLEAQKKISVLLR